MNSNPNFKIMKKYNEISNIKLISKLIIFIISFLLFIPVFSQNNQVIPSYTQNNIGYVMIQMNSNSKIVGLIKSEDENSIYLSKNDGVEISVSKLNIKTIDKLIVNITTIHNQNFKGFYKESNDSILTMINDDNNEIKIPKKNIEEAVLEQRIKDKFSIDGWNYQVIESLVKKKQISIYDNLNQKNNKEYSFFGLTLLNPAVFHIVGGYNFEKTGIRTTLGIAFSIANSSGFQINYLYNLKKIEHFEHNLSLGAGYTLLNGYEWEYLGLFYDFNLYGFFVEPGITIGYGDFKSPQISLQFGYIYRLNN